MICCRLNVYFALLMAFGCATAGKHEVSAISQFDTGRPQAAIEAFSKAAEARKAERELIAVDSAIASLMAADPKSAEQALVVARREIDHLRQKDIREQAAAVLTDDKAVAWSGREFEQRMIDNLLILSSLLGDRQDAIAFANQAGEHLVSDIKSLEKPTAATPQILTAGHSSESAAPPPGQFAANALTAYLTAAVRSEIPMSSDATTAALKDMDYWLANNQHSAVQTGFGVDSSAGHGVLHVITFVGRITDWQPEASAPTSAALLLADQILSAVGDHTLPPTIAPVRIARPILNTSRSPMNTAVRLAGHKEFAVSRTLLDLNKVAHQSYLNDRDHQIARAVARRIVKKGAVYAAKDQLALSNDSGADVLLTLGGIAWEALEKPDLRHVRLLPERIDVLQLQLPAGQHQIELQTSVSSTAKHQTATVNIDNGRNTFVLCFRPQADVCEVVTSR